MSFAGISSLNADLLLLLFQLISDDIYDFLSLSATCKRLQDVSLHRSIWTKLYRTHKLYLAFGPNSRHQAPALKRYVVHYLKVKKNLESACPKATSCNFYPIELAETESLACHFYGRFMFHVTQQRDSGSISVACYDMNDSLKLIWVRRGEWTGWTMVKIHTCEIDLKEVDEESQMTVLMQCGDENRLNFRAFSIKQSDTSVEMFETRSLFFNDENPNSGHYKHHGKWIFRTSLPIHLIDTETSRNYSLDVPIPQGFGPSLTTCAFVGTDHIMVVFRGNRPSTKGTHFSFYGISDLNQREPISKLHADEHNQSIHSSLNIVPRSVLTLSDASTHISFIATMVSGYRAATAIVNISYPKPNASGSLEIASCGSFMLGSSVSQYRGWIVDFVYRTNPRFLFVPIQPQSGGGLEFGEVKKVSFPENVASGIGERLLDEHTGKLYFTTRSEGKFGLCVLDFA